MIEVCSICLIRTSCSKFCEPFIKQFGKMIKQVSSNPNSEISKKFNENSPLVFKAILRSKDLGHNYINVSNSFSKNRLLFNIEGKLLTNHKNKKGTNFLNLEQNENDL